MLLFVVVAAVVIDSSRQVHLVVEVHPMIAWFGGIGKATTSPTRAKPRWPTLPLPQPQPQPNSSAWRWHQHRPILRALYLLSPCKCPRLTDSEKVWPRSIERTDGSHLVHTREKVSFLSSEASRRDAWSCCWSCCCCCCCCCSWSWPWSLLVRSPDRSLARLSCSVCVSLCLALLPCTPPCALSLVDFLLPSLPFPTSTLTSCPRLPPIHHPSSIIHHPSPPFLALVASSLSSPNFTPPVSSSAPSIINCRTVEAAIISSSVQLLTTAGSQGYGTHWSLPRIVTNSRILVSPQSRAINSRSCPLFSFSLHANPAIII
ncbi:uncharacterized protein LY89DRAFT_77675 [Mollisia scopiformis]|uniref:Secreted protein n=1 Tax=Mollisia scopiformis TaxID=149040 RepID=A0A194X8W2_MOLSC|nr:uncharacterized protein LY89DRAFT_77675 [Mollisia scopiformis]KUJ16222.1 hypothetical protein LY89DRAFT_77675 [Mollisia scopiformis]